MLALIRKKYFESHVVDASEPWVDFDILKVSFIREVNKHSLTIKQTRKVIEIVFSIKFILKRKIGIFVRLFADTLGK